LTKLVIFNNKFAALQSVAEQESAEQLYNVTSSRYCYKLQRKLYDTLIGHSKGRRKKD